MTEEEWLGGSDPSAMQEFLRGTVSERTLRLFVSACCRRHAHRFLYAEELAAVEMAERYADGLVGRADLSNAGEAIRRIGEPWQSLAEYATDPDDDNAARITLGVEWLLENDYIWEGKADPSWDVVHGAELRSQAADLRDIFGNPFRPVAIRPAWFTPTVIGLAGAIYAKRAFDRMPILADALEEAGCDDPEVLTHCRSDGPHVRGCWVVDRLVAKREEDEEIAEIAGK